MTFQVIPSLDVLEGGVVRLVEGDFARMRRYDDVESIVARWPAGTLVHVVDLAASLNGAPSETEFVRRLVERGFRVQVGGGVRSVRDAEVWLRCGATRVVAGTIACDAPETFRNIVDAVGAAQVLPAVDLRDGEVRVNGWTRNGVRSVEETFRALEDLGCEEALVTDISRDGKLAGPSLRFYRELAGVTSVRIIASGGVSSRDDLQRLAALPNVSGAVVGKAILERRIELPVMIDPSRLAPRVIPCLDVKEGRVTKGVRFQQLRDSGDPAELARRYELEGADEIVLLDVAATISERATAIETVSRVAQSLFIPLTVGGGVRTLDDFRSLLRAGADRVAINSAAIARPRLLAEAASEFGAQAVVLACDAIRRSGDSGVWFEVMASAGTKATRLDAVAWCRQGAKSGAGEILLTSIDRDGTGEGFDLDLLRRVSAAVNVGVIASGGAGSTADFVAAIEEGGAAAVLAASLFHERIVSIADVKRSLAAAGIRVREVAA